MRAANERGGPDNVSVIIIDVVGSRTFVDWRAPQRLLAGLVRPAAWRQVADELHDVVLADGKGYHSPRFLGAVLLLALALIILGFVMGWLIFRLT